MLRAASVNCFRSNFNTGASSGFALLSPRGLSWVQQKTGSTQFNEVLHKLRHQAQLWPQINASQWWPTSNFTRHLLPSKEVAARLVARESVLARVKCASLTFCRLLRLLQRYISTFRSKDVLDLFGPALLE
jgi:hypothetical protein